MIKPGKIATHDGTRYAPVRRSIRKLGFEKPRNVGQLGKGFPRRLTNFAVLVFAKPKEVQDRNGAANGSITIRDWRSRPAEKEAKNTWQY
jgi:hypothetical protein